MKSCIMVGVLVASMLLTSCGEKSEISYSAVKKSSDACEQYIEYLECSLKENPSEQHTAIRASIEAVKNFPDDVRDKKCVEAYSVLVQYKEQAEEFWCKVEEID